MSLVAPVRPPALPPDSTHVPPVSLETLADIAAGLGRARDLWASLLDVGSSARGGIRLVATDAYEAWLLAWPPGSSVDPHDHGESHGAFAVVDGELIEVRWAGSARHSRWVGARELVTFGVGIVHDVVATGRDPALSIHVYSPPLVEMRFFSDDARRVLGVERVDPEPALLESAAPASSNAARFG